jgi:hypothetical protein
MDFVPRDAVGDGNGGLLIAGELTSSESAVPQIWRSADGRSFVQAEVESFMSGTAGIAATASGSGEIVAVAASAGKFVAFGDHHVVDTNKTSGEALGLDVWHSANGSTWSHVALPGSDGYQAASMTAWKGGFAAVGNSDTGDDVPAVWLSPDGVSWHKSGDVPAFGAVSVVALGDRVVCLGAKRDSTLGMVPASWSSTDGKTWREGVAPVDGGYGSIFDLAAVQGSTLYGIGMSHIAWAGTGSDPSASPNASPSLAFKVVPSTIWASTDGTTWSRVGPAPDYSQYTSSLIVFDGHLVLAIQGLDGVVVSTGNLP